VGAGGAAGCIGVSKDHRKKKNNMGGFVGSGGGRGKQEGWKNSEKQSNSAAFLLGTKMDSQRIVTST